MRELLIVRCTSIIGGDRTIRPCSILLQRPTPLWMTRTGPLRYPTGAEGGPKHAYYVISGHDTKHVTIAGARQG